MELRDVLAGEAPRAVEPEQDAAVERLAGVGADERGGARLAVARPTRARARAEQSAAEQSAAAAAGGNRRRTSCVAGPETRTTATPARPGAVESAKMVSAGASRADADADVEASAALASDRRDHRAAAADARRRITEEGAALGTRCAQKKSFLRRSRRTRQGADFIRPVPETRENSDICTYAFQSGIWILEPRAAARASRGSWLHLTRRASSPPPAKMGKPKGKRAHRKIDVGEDAYIEKKREDAAAGGAVDELPDDSLFFVDNDGGIAAGGGMAMPTSRKAKARAKTLRVDAILTKAKTARPFAVPVPRGSRARPPRRSTPRAPSSRRPPRRSSRGARRLGSGRRANRSPSRAARKSRGRRCSSPRGGSR